MIVSLTDLQFKSTSFFWHEGDSLPAAPTSRKAEAQPSLAALLFLVEVREEILTPYLAPLCFHPQPYGSISHSLVLLEGWLQALTPGILETYF